MSPPKGSWVAVFLAGLGTFWAYQRGAGDFAVFHEAAHWVVTGHADWIYRLSPDRFLYAPGFAWLVSPLGALPRDWALGVWCIIKALAFAMTLDAVTRAVVGGSRRAGWIALLAAAFIARPLLIDFQYGQVNLLILCASVWALFGDAKRGPPWAVLAAAAVSKLVALPLLLVPWLNRSGGRARVATVLGAAGLIAVPFLAMGPARGWDLYAQWWEALAARGLPLESHNQSFSAFLHHYFSGRPTHVLMMAQARDYSTGWTLGPGTLLLVSSAWSALWMGVLLGWLVSARRRTDPVRWAAVAIALLIVPSHLAWKPYFVMGLPVAAVAVADALASRAAWRWLILAAAFGGINLTGFDFVGHELAARLEASSLFLFAHLAVTGLAATAPPQRRS